MMNDLRNSHQESEAPVAKEVIESLVLTAVLPSQPRKARLLALEKLPIAIPGVTRGYERGNQIYVETDTNGEISEHYICDVPADYMGRDMPGFRIEGNIQTFRIDDTQTLDQ
jgi:hypothetical protein